MKTMKRTSIVNLAATVLLLAAAGGRAQSSISTTPGVKAGQTFESTRVEAMPREFENVRVDEKLKARLPLEAIFTNEKGESVTLGDYFRSGRPAILQMGYMSCPKLCDVISQGTARSLSDLDLELGKDYDVIYISIDPKEKPDLAAAKKRTYIGEYAIAKKLDDAGIERANGSWHLLTGQEDAIRQVADAIGFKYKWVSTGIDEGQYSHPAVITLLTPAGSVSSYLYGAAFDAKLLRKGLVDAGAGKSGTLMDQIVLYCLHLGPDGKYTLQATRLMQLGGVLTVVCLFSTLGLFQLRSRFSRGLPARKTGLSAVLGDPRPANPNPASPGSIPSTPDSTFDSTSDSTDSAGKTDL